MFELINNWKVFRLYWNDKYNKSAQSKYEVKCTFWVNSIDFMIQHAKILDKNRILLDYCTLLIYTYTQNRCNSPIKIYSRWYY